ncbi:MAG: PEP-CTERM sorting domain-containing protein, partial [Rhodospirillales bacterium]|nr:PEP-CTERM sorting domain-containing protein [Rhodospirillales bacterium]
FTGTVISKVTLAYNSALSVLVGTNKTSGPTPTPSPVNVPEPASLVLLGFGAGAIGLLRRRRKA